LHEVSDLFKQRGIQLYNIAMKRNKTKSKAKETLPFKEILRELLTERGISQREFSRLIDVPSSTVDSWLAGSIPTDLFAIKRAAKLFGVSVSYLFYGTNDEVQKPISIEELFTSEKVVQGYYKVSVEKLTIKPN